MNENIEKVLAALDGFRMNDEMTYSAYSVLHDEISLLDDLLKAQEPRIMTLTETKTMNAPVFFEIKSGVIYDWVIRCNANEKYVFFAIRNGTIQIYRVDRYGISWRCWTSRPTDEQRKAVKWDG